MPTSSNTNLLFATPVILDRVEQPDLDVALEQAILARRNGDGSSTGLHEGSWQSDNGFLGWGGDAASRLLAHVLEVANAHTIVKGDRPDADYEWSALGWANVNEPGAGSPSRLNPESFWSAIYCVRVDPGTGGELALLDPRSPAMEMSAPHLWFANAGIQREASIAVPAGTLVLFPSWLRHAVTPWQGEGLRIWVGMNLSVKMS